MDLILWRHAEAQDWVEGCDDLDRALTGRGEKQANRMAQWLDRQLPDGVRVLCSPARRCEQTALALNRKYKVREELAPYRTPEQLLQAAQWPHSRQAVLVVGHQPALGQVLAQLLHLRLAACPVRKGAVWWVRSRERDGHEQTLVLTVQSPDLM